MTIFELPPFLILLVGALVVAVLPAGWRSRVFPVFPLLSLLVVWSLEDGARLAVPVLWFELTLLSVDQLSRIFGLIFSLIVIVGGIYALHMSDRRQQVAALVYAAGALTVTFAGDWLTLYLGWEAMAVASTFLIWSRDTPEAIATGMRYLVFHILGGALLLAGILLHAAEAGSLAITALPSGASVGAWLILAGVAVNTAIPPLHAWLSESYPAATVTGAVFLSALTTKSAVYVLARVFPGWEILVVMGVIMALYGVVYAVLANDIRAILAYHIISQVGYMVAGVGLGTQMAINGTTAHAFSHILYKALLFMGAGAVLHATGKSRLTELGGIYSNQRLIFWLYMIGAFSISGFPLFNGFISKSIIVSAASLEGRDIVTLLLLLASVGTFLHTGLKLPYWTWFGQDRGLTVGKTPRNMVWAMGVTAFLCTFYGIFPGVLYAKLPFPEVVYNPFQAYHLIEMIQILIFTFIAFWILRHKLGGEPYIAVDFEYVYRLTAKGIYGLAEKPIGRADALWGETYRRFASGLRGFAVRVVAHRVEPAVDGGINRMLPHAMVRGGNDLLELLRADSRDLAVNLSYVILMATVLIVVALIVIVL
jgi:multicomponent Na+:H+ antiporter subunit D